MPPTQTFTPQAQIDRQSALGRQLLLQSQQPARSGLGVLGQGLTALAGGLTQSRATQNETANQQLSQGILRDIGAPGGGFAANAPQKLLGGSEAQQNLAIQLMTSREAARAKVEAAQSVSQAKIEAARLKAQQPTPLQRNVKASLDPSRTQSERDALSLAINKPLVTNQFKAEGAEAVGLAGINLKQFEKGIEAANKANNQLAVLEAMDAAADDPNFFSGSFGESVLGFKRFVSTVLNVEVKGLTSANVIQFGGHELIKEAIKMQGKGFSEGDRKAAEAALPGLGKSKVGMKITIGMLRRGLQHQINLQNIRDNHLRDKKTLVGMRKALQPAREQYVANTQADLKRLKTIAEATTQPSIFAGMPMSELQKVNIQGLIAAGEGVKAQQAANRMQELMNATLAAGAAAPATTPALVPAR